MTPNQKKEIQENHVIINGKVIHKAVVIQVISEWARRKFAFRSGEVYLHSDPDLHEIIDGLEDSLLDLEKFKKAFGENKALDYMLFVSFLTGMKAGREETINDRKDEEHDETAVREYKIKLIEKLKLMGDKEVTAQDIIDLLN